MSPKAEVGIIIVNDEPSTLLKILSCIVDVAVLRISETWKERADHLVLQTASVCFHQDYMNL